MMIKNKTLTRLISQHGIMN